VAPPSRSQVGTVIQKAMPIEITVIGAAEPLTSVAIRAQTTGQLTGVNFTEGDDVTAGQTLFTLDRRPLEAALCRRRPISIATWRRPPMRCNRPSAMTSLAQRGIATREQVDTSRTTVAALNATVDADKAAVENAKVQLEYATILAPITGRTGVLMVHEGNLVRANDQTALVVINQVAPISVSFAIPEARLPELKKVHGRRRAARHGECAERRRVTGGRSHHLRRQLRRSDDGHDQD
jgi:multidrug efflux system membrane fusion protein